MRPDRQSECGMWVGSRGCGLGLGNRERPIVLRDVMGEGVVTMVMVRGC